MQLGAPIGRGKFAINHLLFADDCIMFDDASVEGAHVVQNIIKEYELNSGQQVNFDKSFIYFGACGSLREGYDHQCFGC